MALPLRFAASTEAAIRYRFLMLKCSSPCRKQSNFSVSERASSRRPTSRCDPYGQGGKPLPYIESKNLLDATLEPKWKLDCAEDGGKDEGVSIETLQPPLSLYREFYHKDFMLGSKFLSYIAAVAYNNGHFPQLTLERRLFPKDKEYRVVTTVKCFTPVLGGLSYNDFHIATMIDIEITREEVAKFLS